MCIRDRLCERIAFTLLEYQNAVSALKPSRGYVQLFADLCKKSLAEMVRCSRDCGYHLYDWHFGNLAFSDAINAKVILIHWQENGPARSDTKLKVRMKQPVEAFVKGFTRYCNAGISGTWVSYFRSLESVIASWWRSLHSLPSDEDVKWVFAELDSAAASCIDILPSSTTLSLIHI